MSTLLFPEFSEIKAAQDPIKIAQSEGYDRGRRDMEHAYTEQIEQHITELQSQATSQISSLHEDYHAMLKRIRSKLHDIGTALAVETTAHHIAKIIDDYTANSTEPPTIKISGPSALLQSVENMVTPSTDIHETANGYASVQINTDVIAFELALLEERISQFLTSSTTSEANPS